MKSSLALALLSATLALPAHAAENTSRFVALGRTATVDGLRITPIKVLSDSRCPINARCIWMGELRVEVKIAYQGRARTVELVQGKPQSLPWGRIELTDALPQPLAGREKAPPYRLKFRAERRDIVYLRKRQLRPSGSNP